MLRLARLAWLSPVPIAVRSGRINRSYIGKYDSLSFAEEKHKPMSDSILLLNPHSMCARLEVLIASHGLNPQLDTDAANKNMRAESIVLSWL